MGGSILQICTLMSFSKHLLTFGVRLTGRQSFGLVTLLFFGTGMMTKDLEQVGSWHYPRGEGEVENVCDYTSQVVRHML